jgi:Tfp pilus assembly protein PilZ
MSRKPAEQRASDRIPIGSPATLKWEGEELTGFVETVNLAGGFVACSRLPEIGDYVQIVFSLPGERRTFHVRGNVVFLDAPPATSARRAGFGARFERPPVALLDAIRGLNKGH